MDSASLLVSNYSIRFELIISPQCSIDHMFYGHLAYETSIIQGTSSFESSRWLEDNTPGYNTVGHSAGDEWLFARLDVLKFPFKFVAGRQDNLANSEPLPP